MTRRGIAVVRVAAAAVFADEPTAALDTGRWTRASELPRPIAREGAVAARG